MFSLWRRPADSQIMSAIRNHLHINVMFYCSFFTFSENGQFRLHPGLYPVLMILGRLLPSILEGKDTNLKLGDFIPYVVR
jgi:hypothetical protein